MREREREREWERERESERERFVLMIKETRKWQSPSTIDSVTTISSIIGLVVWVFTNDLRDQDLILGWVITKTPKISSFLNSQNYKVGIKGKVEQSRERRSTSLYTSVSIIAIEKGGFGSPSTTLVNITFYLYIYICVLSKYSVKER